MLGLLGVVVNESVALVAQSTQVAGTMPRRHEASRDQVMACRLFAPSAALLAQVGPSLDLQLAIETFDQTSAFEAGA